ncbi:hypothetical protein NL676_010887 [Syzygium grande]|nr:hypothetical protein NL676_010887 [Syzygium grande]
MVRSSTLRTLAPSRNLWDLNPCGDPQESEHEEEPMDSEPKKEPMESEPKEEPMESRARGGTHGVGAQEDPQSRKHEEEPIEIKLDTEPKSVVAGGGVNCRAWWMLPLGPTIFVSVDGPEDSASAMTQKSVVPVAYERQVPPRASKGTGSDEQSSCMVL